VKPWCLKWTLFGMNGIPCAGRWWRRWTQTL